MFCTNCGAQLEDGVKFCTNCGTPTGQAQAPAPVAPEAPVEVPVQPVVPEVPVEVPPQPVTPEVPVEVPPQPAAPEAPVEVPARPAAPESVDWSAPAASAIPPETPTQPTAPQPQWQQPAAGDAQPKKKGKGGLIAGIIAAVLALVIGVGGFVWPGFLKKGGASSRGLSPETLYQAVETDGVETMSGHVATAYDNLLMQNVSSDDIGVGGTLRIEPGDKLRALLLDAVGDTLNELNPGEDLSWLQSISVSCYVGRSDGLTGLEGTLQLNGTDLLHLNLISRSSDGALWLSVPELSDRYLQTTAENLNLDSLLPGAGSLGGALGGADPEQLESLLKALPEAKSVEELLNRYLKEAVALITDVKKTEGTLTVDEVSADYTVLTATVTPETAVKILETIGPALREDKDVKSILTAVAAAQGKDGAAEYQAFQTRIDEALADHTKLTDKLKDDVVIRLYLDSENKVRGRILECGSTRLELLMPEKDGSLGVLIRYADKDGQKFMLFGSGKRSGDKFSGELELEAGGEYYGVIGLDGFDIEQVKDGILTGSMELKPSASFWRTLLNKVGGEEAEIPESLRGLLDALTFRVDLNTAGDQSEITLTVFSGSDRLLTIAAEGTRTAAKAISAAEGVEPDEWMEDLSLYKIMKVLTALGQAGVPKAYTDALGSLLAFVFV